MPIIVTTITEEKVKKRSNAHSKPPPIQRPHQKNHRKAISIPQTRQKKRNIDRLKQPSTQQFSRSNVRILIILITIVGKIPIMNHNAIFGLYRFSFLYHLDCQWTEWDTWSDCSMTCGTGSKTTRRRVLVVQQNGGDECSGGTIRSKSCNKQHCPGKETFSRVILN